MGNSDVDSPPPSNTQVLYEASNSYAFSSVPPPYNSPEENNRFNDVQNIVLPITDFPTCTEPGCNEIFYSNYWTGCKSKFLNHLLKKHAIPINSTKLWCSICKKYMLNSASIHSCYKVKSIFAINFNNYPFRFQCHNCLFNSPNRKDLNNHKCILSRTIRSTIPDNTVSPPHLRQVLLKIYLIRLMIVFFWQITIPVMRFLEQCAEST